ncbi:hypothetical protein HZS_1259 [Henneguya salminicola]|nr:hypothetical protein HZS_1259 [Henneguya salminicola]
MPQFGILMDYMEDLF